MIRDPVFNALFPRRWDEPPSFRSFLDRPVPESIAKIPDPRLAYSGTRLWDGLVQLLWCAREWWRLKNAVARRVGNRLWVRTSPVGRQAILDFDRRAAVIDEAHALALATLADVGATSVVPDTSCFCGLTRSGHTAFPNPTRGEATEASLSDARTDWERIVLVGYMRYSCDLVNLTSYLCKLLKKLSASPLTLLRALPLAHPHVLVSSVRAVTEPFRVDGGHNAPTAGAGDATSRSAARQVVPPVPKSLSAFEARHDPQNGETLEESVSANPNTKASTRGRHIKTATIRRAEFAKPLREEGWSWPSICAAYCKKYPRDVDVSEGILRRAFERQFPELSSKLKADKATE